MSVEKSYDFYQQLQKAIPDEKRAIEELNKFQQFSGFEHKTGKSEKADSYSPIQDEWLEIKVDYTEYPNHFVEKFSSLEDKKIGGPWQYLQRGVKYYVFYYKKLGQIYVFETETLVKKMIELLKHGLISDKANGSKVSQKNASYHTYGYKVKKEILDDICILHISI